MPAAPTLLPPGAWRFLPTLALGGLGGVIAYLIDLPLPWLLGALITTTLASLAGVRLGSPGRLRKGVLVVIGVMGVVMYELFALVERRMTGWATRGSDPAF